MRGIGMLLFILLLVLVGASLSAAIQTVLIVKLTIFAAFVGVATVMIAVSWLRGAGRDT